MFSVHSNINHHRGSFKRLLGVDPVRGDCAEQPKGDFIYPFPKLIDKLPLYSYQLQPPDLQHIITSSNDQHRLAQTPNNSRRTSSISSHVFTRKITSEHLLEDITKLSVEF